MQIYTRDGMDNSIGECGCRATALIVDDNAFNLIPLEVLLRGLGIETQKALGG